MLAQVPFANEDEIADLAALIVNAWNDKSTFSSD